MPAWLWPACAVALVLGARELWRGPRPIALFYLLPAILSAAALGDLVATRAGLILVVPAFIFSLLIGIGIGWNLVSATTRPIRTPGNIEVPTSVSPLLAAIATVILHIAIFYIYGRWPALRANPAIALEFSATAALLAGILWGRVFRLGRLARRA
ncbi:MAG: hypothetical protein ACREFD_02970 [Stellaceae bacterium]